VRRYNDPTGASYNRYEAIQLRTNGTMIYTVQDGDIVPFYSVTVLPSSPTVAEIVYLDASLGIADIELNPVNTEYIIMRIDSGSAFTCTITVPLTYTINGCDDYVLSVGGETVHLLLSGTNYLSI